MLLPMRLAVMMCRLFKPSCQQIFVVRPDGFSIEQLATTYPYKRAWYWTGLTRIQIQFMGFDWSHSRLVSNAVTTVRLPLCAPATDSQHEGRCPPIDTAYKENPPLLATYTIC